MSSKLVGLGLVSLARLGRHGAVLLALLFECPCPEGRHAVPSCP